MVIQMGKTARPAHELQDESTTLRELWITLSEALDDARNGMTGTRVAAALEALSRAHQIKPEDCSSYRSMNRAQLQELCSERIAQSTSGNEGLFLAACELIGSNRKQVQKS